MRPGFLYLDPSGRTSARGPGITHRLFAVGAPAALTRAESTSTMSRISLIVAVASNGVIGRGNALPWHLPEDLAYFKRTTTGHTIIMGRKTLESIGRALPNRRNIVVSGSLLAPPEGVQAAASLEAALALCGAEAEVFIIGGAKLYHAAIERADRLLVTEIHRDIEGDVSFPPIPGNFRETTRSRHQAASDPNLHFDFVVYERGGDSVGGQRQ